jgi:zinc/manganese transport system substrate-binding protein
MNKLRAALMLSLCLPVAAAHAQDRLKVVASFSILGDMVSRVGGDLVDVRVIVGPNADAHVYEPKPVDAAALSQAQVFVVNGLGFEGWMDRFTGATAFTGATIIASRGVATRKMQEDGADITDPHAWQNLANGVVYVKNIADGLCQASPADCGKFRANAQSYSAEISKLDGDVKAQVAAIPGAKRKVITTHEAFGYFGDAYGIAFLAPEGISTESEASAKDVAALIDQIRKEKVTALFVENMSDPRLIAQIASETGVKRGGELYSDALSEPDQGAGTYLEMFMHNVAALVPAMAGS